MPSPLGALGIELLGERTMVERIRIQTEQNSRRRQGGIAVEGLSLDDGRYGYAPGAGRLHPQAHEGGEQIALFEIVLRMNGAVE